MAKQTVNTLKGWYITYAKPVQQQFWDWLDSYRHKDDLITFDDLDDGLQDVFQSIGAGYSQPVTMAASKSFIIPAGFSVYKIYVNTDYPDAQIFIGETEGASNLLDAVDIVSGATLPISIDLVADADREIWFSVPVVDFPLNTRLKIYLQKI